MMVAGVIRVFEDEPRIGFGDEVTDDEERDLLDAVRTAIRIGEFEVKVAVVNELAFVAGRQFFVTNDDVLDVNDAVAS